MLTHVFDEQMVDQKKKFKDNKQLIQLLSIRYHCIANSIPIKDEYKYLLDKKDNIKQQTNTNNQPNNFFILIRF
jgi:hypothetical protein